MNATVERRPVTPPRWRAWCEQCQDGYQAGTKKTAERWADKHNKERHPAA